MDSPSPATLWPLLSSAEETRAKRRGDPFRIPTVIDEATGQKVAFVKWVNLSTGEFEAYREDPKAALEAYENSGRDWNLRQEFVDSLLFSGKARLPIPVEVHRPTKGSPRIKTPAEEAREIRSIARDYGLTEMPAVPGLECEYPGCHQLARFRTGDEQIIDPAVGPNGELFERAFTKRVHLYCRNPRHWRAPIQTSIRGVESEVEVATRPE